MPLDMAISEVRDALTFEKVNHSFVRMQVAQLTRRGRDAKILITHLPGEHNVATGI